MKASSILIIWICALCIIATRSLAIDVDISDEETYSVGSGISDITGPANDEGMLGYAHMSQIDNGIHFRQFARCFVFVADDNTRFVHCTTDLCMVFRSVMYNVVLKLQEKYGPTMYTEENVMIGAVHTHSGPAGFSWNIMFDLTTLGFNKKCLHAIVDGIVEAIVMAHENVQDNCKLRLMNSTITDITVNRSPTSYTANPAEERAKYEHDTDKEYWALRIEDKNGDVFGMINWFAIHSVSMPNTNQLISGDNAGVAAALVEEHFNGLDVFPGKGKIITSFPNCNEGDSTPNIEGAFCDKSMKPCSLWESTCEGDDMKCHGYGPGWFDWFNSTFYIGSKRAGYALDIVEKAASAPVLKSQIAFKHMFVDMANITVSPEYSTTGEEVHTCKQALGYSMAAGTTDGPGAWSFFQGDNYTSNPIVDFIMSIVDHHPSEELKQCHKPKEILFDLGEAKIPWTPSVAPLQIARLGRLFIVAVPTEMTTMSGRRVKETVRQTLVNNGIEDPIVVINGLTNDYMDYTATYEEYQYQRYEGGSTPFGPHTLDAYQQSYATLAAALVTGSPLPNQPSPKEWDEDKLLNFYPPPIVDEHPPEKEFGSVHSDVDPTYKLSTPDAVTTVKVVFWGAQLRNNYMRNKSFLYVERQSDDGTWVPVLSDAHWDTKIRWERDLLLFSKIHIDWELSLRNPPATGVYRIRHLGYAKKLLHEEPVPYEGVSSQFNVN